ncbi:hypothetical protein J4416_04950 [Candidatus Pacearchaeota archaeon]|nr:hypothetical protein [Candidatus Pacearchaeota archaeon]
MNGDKSGDEDKREIINYYLDLTHRLGDRDSKFSPEIPPVFYLNRGLGLGFCSNLGTEIVRRYESVRKQGKIIDGRFGSPEPA